jgi:hypothetical protein
VKSAAIMPRQPSVPNFIGRGWAGMGPVLATIEGYSELQIDRF